MIHTIKKRIKTLFANISHRISYSTLRAIGWPISLLSYKNIQRLGRGIGFLAYLTLRNFRKRALGNLAIAAKIALSDREKTRVCKECFQNLAITCLEFFRLHRKPQELSSLVIHHNSEKTRELLSRGQGVIFLIGHLSNWEIPFIEITRQYPGVAIAKPIKNPYLNRFILSIRQINKGRIVYPRNALSTSMKELKLGHFAGIVGDQALTESSYSYPFLGVRAWTSPSAALLAYKTNCPIIVGTISREEGKYHITHSDPIWPNLDHPLKEEVIRVMDQSMSILENAVMKHPGQWLWQHDRWKQAYKDSIKKTFRHAFILIVLTDIHLELIPIFKELYPRSFLTFFVPIAQKAQYGAEKNFLFYQSSDDLHVNDWRYQCIYDFSNTPSLEKHFKKLGAFSVLNLEKMQKYAKKQGKKELLDPTKIESLIKFCITKYTQTIGQSTFR